MARRKVFPRIPGQDLRRSMRMGLACGDGGTHPPDLRKIAARVADSLRVAADCEGRQARSPLDQSKLTCRGPSWNAAVDLEGSKQFDIGADDVFRVEGSQMIILGHYPNGSALERIVARQGNQRSHVANLTIESGTDLTQDFRNWHVRGNGVKDLRLSFQRRVDSGFSSARQNGTLPPFAGEKMRFLRLPSHFQFVYLAL